MSTTSTDSYLIALLVLLPLLSLICVTLLVYMCCAKRWRLNWFQRVLLEEAEITHHSNDANPSLFGYAEQNSQITAELPEPNKSVKNESGINGGSYIDVGQQTESCSSLINTRPCSILPAEKSAICVHRISVPNLPSSQTIVCSSTERSALLGRWSLVTSPNKNGFFFEQTQSNSAGARIGFEDQQEKQNQPREQVNRKFSFERFIFNLKNLANSTLDNDRSSATTIDSSMISNRASLNNPKPMQSTRKRTQSMSTSDKAISDSESCTSANVSIESITTNTSSCSTLSTGINSSLMAAYPKEFKRERRRASMQDAIDATKINTEMYTKLNTFNNLTISSIQEENLGQLHLTLDYNRETNILTVFINQAIDIVPKERSGAANPYCRVAILPNRKNQTQTHIMRNTLQPNFNEKFLFEILTNDWTWSILEITLFDYDQFSMDECLGQVKVPLVDFDLEIGLKKYSFWKGISGVQKKEKGDQSCGDVQFSLAYLNSAKRLNVVIFKARNLSGSQPHDIMTETYVKVTLTIQRGKKVKKKKTSAQRSFSNPEWNEALIFNVAFEDIRSVALDFQVFVDSVLNGWLHVGPDSNEDEYQHWSDMVQGKGANARWHSLVCPSSSD